MPYLVNTNCTNCGRDYRFSSDAPYEETLCPFADCMLTEDDDE